MIFPKIIMNGFKIMESEGFDYGKLAAKEVSNEVILISALVVIMILVATIVIVLNYRNNKKSKEFGGEND